MKHCASVQNFVSMKQFFVVKTSFYEQPRIPVKRASYLKKGLVSDREKKNFAL
jgi:hypothetical protein